MEQTLLPDGVQLAAIAVNKKGSVPRRRAWPEKILAADPLTLSSFRVMYVSVSTKEVRNANRRQEPETWDPSSGPVPQAELLLRCSRGRRRQAPLPPGGRPGVQEPLGGGYGHHRTCLRRVGLLERGDGHCRPCAPAYREFPGGDSADRGEAAKTTLGEGGQPDVASAPATVLAPAAEHSDAAKKGFFRTPNQRGVPEGQTRWYCHDCGKSFLVATGQTPKACPEGHQAG